MRMSLNVSHIKNPLTVISIFAGLSEISGTCVLPFIKEPNQYLFIWFLMLFPIALIGLFFYTLNFNHRVLYAPSDYKDEDNFLMGRASYLDKRKKIEREVDESSTDDLDESELKDDAGSKVDSMDNVDIQNNIDESLKENTKSEINEIAQDFIKNIETESKLERAADAVREMQKSIAALEKQKNLRYVMKEKSIYLSEKMALDKLSKDLDLKIEKDVKITMVDYHPIIVDGVAISKEEVHLFEVKFNPNMNVANNLTKQIMDYNKVLREKYQSYRIITHIVFVNDNEAKDLNKEIIRKIRYSSNERIVFHEFNFDELLFGQA